MDLFRASKDGGIDFLAVHDTSSDPIVYAVQCKHPDKKQTAVSLRRWVFLWSSKYMVRRKLLICKEASPLQARHIVQLLNVLLT